MADSPSPDPVTPQDDYGNEEFGAGDQGIPGSDIPFDIGDDSGMPMDEVQLGEGHTLPPFASQENKDLNLLYYQKDAELVEIDERIHGNADRIKNMQEHLNNVQQEITMTQKLADAKRSESATEVHLQKLAQRELNRIQKENETNFKAQEDSRDRACFFENAIFKANEKMDMFKVEMNWNQEELEQWALAARQKEEDELAIEKYRRTDDAKMRELIWHVENLSQGVDTAKKKLEAEVTETESLQIQMDKTGEMFRGLHNDRKGYIEQWERAVEQMKMLDKYLEQMGEVYAEKLQAKRAVEKRREDKRVYEKQVVAEIEQIETSVADARRETSRCRLEHSATKDRLVLFKEEVEVLRQQLAATASARAAERGALSKAIADAEHGRERIEQVKKQKIATQKSLEAAKIGMKSETGKVDMIQNNHKELLDRLNEAEKDAKAVKEELFRESQELYKLRNDEATTLGEISGAGSAIKNLTSQVGKLDAERQRQQELLYAVDFQSQMMERKVARVSGERTVEEKEQISKKFIEMEEEFAKQVSLQKVLKNQIRIQDSEYRQRTRERKDLEAARERMNAIMNELKMQTGVMQREMDQVKRNKENTLVSHDVMKLEERRLREEWNKKLESTFALENKKAQLAISMEERNKEIEAHQNVLKAQLRVSQEEKHALSIQLSEKQAQVGNAKNRFAKVHAKSNPEGGETLSQAQIVLRAAMEKESLQRQGDVLDEKIRFAEKELVAMEAMLVDHLKPRNEKYKSSLISSGAQDQELVQQQQKLQEQYRAIKDTIEARRDDLEEVQRQNDEDCARKEELLRDIEGINLARDQYEQQTTELQNLLHQQVAQHAEFDEACQALVQNAVSNGTSPEVLGQLHGFHHQRADNGAIVEALRQIVGQEGEDPQLAEQLEESFAQHALGAV